MRDGRRSSQVPVQPAHGLAIDAVAHLLQARAVQDFKRGGPLGGSAYDAVITRANEDYANALTQRRRRIRGSYLAS